jgi:hypothetical protein
VHWCWDELLAPWTSDARRKRRRRTMSVYSWRDGLEGEEEEEEEEEEFKRSRWHLKLPSKCNTFSLRLKNGSVRDSVRDSS